MTRDWLLISVRRSLIRLGLWLVKYRFIWLARRVANLSDVVARFVSLEYVEEQHQRRLDRIRSSF